MSGSEIEVPFQAKEAIEKLKKNEQVVVSYTKTDASKKPPYSIVGNGHMTMIYSDEVMDTLVIFGRLTAKQQDIVLYFRDEMMERQMIAFYAKFKLDNPNLAELSKSKQDARAQYVRGLLRDNGNQKQLVTLNIIRKIDNVHFMLNPFMFIPYNDFDKVAEIWRELKLPEE
jgi:hypothetical protein